MSVLACREREHKYGEGSIAPSGGVASSLPARVHRLPRIEDEGALTLASPVPARTDLRPCCDAWLDGVCKYR